MRRYNPSEIEPKWQKKWDEEAIYSVSADPNKQKMYMLEAIHL